MFVRIEDDLLQLRNTLPAKPSSVTLDGQFTLLVPLTGSNFSEMKEEITLLYQLTNGSEISISNKHHHDKYDCDELVWEVFV